MTIELTDAQIDRVLQLCGKITALRNSLPSPPPGMETRIEVARGLRKTLEENNDTLVELGALLR